MIAAMALRAGHVIVQPVGLGRTAWTAYRTVREVELVAANGGGDWVRALVDEDGGHGYPFPLFYPPNWPVEIHTPRPHRPVTTAYGGHR